LIETDQGGVQHDAQDEDTQSNSKTFQDHRQGKATSAETEAQPPATQKIKASSSVLFQGPARSQGRSEAGTAHSGIAQTEVKTMMSKGVDYGKCQEVAQEEDRQTQAS
jgi:hypothetical protein